MYGILDIHFDDSDWDLIKKFTWSLKQSNKKLYVHAIDCESKLKIYMHRLIMSAPDDKSIDHRDGNGLNNRRDNLRFATQSQNMANRDKMSNNTSGFKGVFKIRNKYKAQIKVNHKSIQGGRLFDNPVDAARRYNEMALKYFGEYARLNEIPE